MKECKSGWVEPLSEETAQGIIEALRKLEEASELSEASNRLAEHIFEDILKDIGLNEDIMKEKKTKKMTKAEAFEWLKGKKIKCICAVAYEDAQANKVERFLKAVGCKYHFANHISWRDWYWPLYGFIVDKKGEIYVAFEDQMDFFEQNFNEPISADDILSIEIVEECVKDDDGEYAANKISLLGSQICEILRQMNGHYHVEITEYSVNLYPEGTNLYHSDPF